MATTTKRTTKKSFMGTAKAKDTGKLSKAGKWMREHPDGILTIIDHKAVLK